MSSGKAWTDGEKLDVFLQIIALSGTIPWEKIKLPEGRTAKAGTMMIEREKKRLGSDPSGDKGETPKAPAPAKGKGKKRSSKVAGLDDGGGLKKAKTKASRETPIESTPEAEIGVNDLVDTERDSDNDDLEKIKQELDDNDDNDGGV